jgi:hypothetical protein
MGYIVGIFSCAVLVHRFSKQLLSKFPKHVRGLCPSFLFSVLSPVTRPKRNLCMPYHTMQEHQKNIAFSLNAPSLR